MTTELLKPRDVMRLTGLGRDAVYGAIHRCELRASRRANRYLIRRDDFEQWLDDGLVQPDDHAVDIAPPRARRRRGNSTTSQARGSVARLDEIERQERAA